MTPGLPCKQVGSVLEPREKSVQFPIVLFLFPVQFVRCLIRRVTFKKKRRTMCYFTMAVVCGVCGSDVMSDQKICKIFRNSQSEELYKMFLSTLKSFKSRKEVFGITIRSCLYCYFIP